jgi:transcriptional regulator with XRE-family HTH domain
MKGIVKREGKEKKGGTPIKRQLNALEKRITQKDLAFELGVSPSTLYRYKTGKTKNPKKNLSPLIAEIWQSVKKVKPAKNLQQKKKNLAKIESDYSYAYSKHFKDSRINNHVYRAKVLPLSVLEDIVSEMMYKFKSPYFMVRLVGTAFEQNEEGEEKEVEQSYSTRFVAIELDGVELLWEQLKALLAKPSKKLKRVKYFEIVCKEFLQ